MKTSVYLSGLVLATMLSGVWSPSENAIAQVTEPTLPRDQGNVEEDNTPREISWRILGPDNGKPYNDPFARLTNEQLTNLGYVARVQRLIEQKKIEADGVDAKEAAELARQLSTVGVDVGWLLVQRKRIQQMRGLQVGSISKTIAETLGDHRVALTGYVIPIEVREGQLTEFFLVPTIAACSHEDAPPRLQVVFVNTEKGIRPPSKRTPVRVTGTIAADTTSRPSYNGNGRVMVHSAYAMSSPEIKVFESTSNPNDLRQP